MKLLFDTHVWLWFVQGDDALPPGFLAAIRSPSNTVFLSVASAWEVQIKTATGKLQLQTPLDVFLEAASERFDVLDISMRHIQSLRQLPTHHRDPFDRMLVAQAHADGLTLMTVDPIVKTYGVDCLSW